MTPTEIIDQLDDARAEIFAKLEAHSTSSGPTRSQAAIETMADEQVQRRADMSAAVAHRANPQANKLPDSARRYRGYTLAELARRSDATRAAAPIYLGDGIQIDGSSLSPDGRWLTAAGIVLVRQMPGSAKGVMFITIEDETGMVNVLCTPGVWAGHRKLAQTASALLIRGQVQNATGAVTVVAERMGRISMKVGSRSRDFR